MEAKENREIDDFERDYCFLSNFYECSVQYEGITYHSTEAAFQAQKTLNEEDKKKFSEMDPDKAKKAGRRVTLRSDWNDVRDKVMEEVLYEKFTQNEDLKKKLLETGDRPLREGNDWHDNYWGDCHCSECSSSPGVNKLGQLLMELRDKLRK